MIQMTINNKNIYAKEGSTILEVAKDNNIFIPTLCHLENVHEIGSCRLCVVEVEGQKNLMASCMTKIKEGMIVKTNTNRVRKARKVLYELILSDHPSDCLNCERNENCELQAIGKYINSEANRFDGEKSKTLYDLSSPSIVRDSSKCILCRRCVTMCNEIQGVGILNPQFRGFKTSISPGEDILLGQAACTFCGQCTTVCPVDALKERDGTELAFSLINDPTKTVVVQTAPAIRAAIGEEFGYPPGTSVTKKMVSALRMLGFDYVFDTNFAADLTIMEEGSELLTRLKGALLDNDKNISLPLITSCSPGWIKYIEHYYPALLPHLSSCKSPHMMLGAITKSFFAKKMNLKKEDVYVVSIMPCTAKKFEITREEMMNDGLYNVDCVLTTRELAKMIKSTMLNFSNLEDSEFDNPLGLSSGAADIFGNTGGVMEAALRTSIELVTSEKTSLKNIKLNEIRGLDRIKESSITINNAKEDWKFLEGKTLKVAVTSGLAGAKILLDQIKNNTSPYHFIEIMACPGGCINGGGQPRSDDSDIRMKRMSALYKEDQGKDIRASHNNPHILKLYEDFLETPLSHISHEYLHTTYVKRNNQYD